MPQFDILIILPIFNALIPIICLYYIFFIHLFIKDLKMIKFRKKVLTLFKFNINIISKTAVISLNKKLADYF
jgi:hypothetical protein